MPNCGSQAILCALPIRFDTYRGCSHGCKYCFTQRKVDLRNIRAAETEQALKSFISGKRAKETAWCDWDIPLHWGGLSDPFQPAEIKYRNSLKCLKIFAETQYPFVVSTKGKLVIDDPYINLLSECNCVVQISALCDKYDAMEAGAPSFAERLKIIECLSGRVKRVIVRAQPYMCEAYKDIMKSIPSFAQAGAYGVIFEGLKLAKKKPGFVKVGGDYVYPLEILKQQFNSLREITHSNSMRFYAGENRLRGMGDNLTCCGVDGLDGFTPNEFNLCHIMNGCKPKISEAMNKVDTAECFTAIDQSTLGREKLRGMSFKDEMLRQYNDNRAYFLAMFGMRQ